MNKLFMLYSNSETPEPGCVERKGYMRRKSFLTRAMPGAINKWTCNRISSKYTAASMHSSASLEQQLIY